MVGGSGLNLWGGVKKLFFFTFGQKGGGSRPIQKILTRKYSDFFDHFDQKLSFLPFFSLRGGGGLSQSKKSLSEKTEVVKRGGGGGLSFFTKSKKKRFFLTPPLTIGSHSKHPRS